MDTRTIEGVTYYRYRVTFLLRVGGNALQGYRYARRKRIVWSPGSPWIWSEVARYLDHLYDLDNIRDGSVRWEVA